MNKLHVLKSACPDLLVSDFSDKAAQMKMHKLLPLALIASTLLAGAALGAQQTPATPSSTGTGSSPTIQSAAIPPTETVSMRTPKGEVTINSAPAPKPIIGNAPPFAQLSGGSKVITAAQAEAYPALVNAFIRVDRDRDGTVDAAEYARWINQP